MPRGHRLANRTMVSIRELDREQFILYPPTAESAIRDFQLRNLQDSGIHYTLYDGDTSTLFYKLLVPVGKGLLLRPTPMMDVPPNAVCLPITGLPHPATMCFFFDKANPKADVQAFARDFPNFAKEVAKADLADLNENVIGKLETEGKCVRGHVEPYAVTTILVHF